MAKAVKNKKEKPSEYRRTDHLKRMDERDKVRALVEQKMKEKYGDKFET